MEASQQVEVYLFFLLGTLVMLLLAGFVVVFFMIYQKRLFRQQIQITEMEASYKEDLLNSNIEMVEAERKRIAQDLHDEVGSLLSTLRLKIRQISPGNKEQTRKIIQESSEMIDSGIQSVRRLSHNITPPGLEMFGLVDTLEDLCEKISTGSGIEAYLHCEQAIDRLHPNAELGLYRVVQELINNTLRHAEATLIEMELKQEGDRITLIYKDNGKGFDPELLEKGKGLGLKNIEARTNYIKGKLVWEVKTGLGMKTIITLSVNPNES